MQSRSLRRRELDKLIQDANIISNDTADPSILVVMFTKDRRVVKLKKYKDDRYEVLEDAVAVETG